MSLFRFPLLRAVASTVGTVRNHFGRKPSRSASDRAYRRLLVDPLEERQLLSLAPINVDQLLVNQTTGANLTAGAQAVAVDHDGDFVVTWTNYDSMYGDGNIHARYFTDEVQRLTLPDEIAVNNIEDTFGTFSLAYNGNEVQKLEISPGYAPSPTFGGFQPSMSGQYTLNFDVDGNGVIGGGETVTVFYNEMSPMTSNSSALQTALQGLGGALSDVTVQAITPQDFIIRFGDASAGEDQPDIIVDTFTFTAGFIPAVVVTPVRDPGMVTNIPVSPDNPELTAFAIEQWFLQNGHFGFGAPVYFPRPNRIPPVGPYIFPEDIEWISPEVSVVALSTTEFDITFVGESAKIDHPELVVTAAHDDLGNSLIGSAQLDVTTLKETSPEFRVNAEEPDDPFTPHADKLDQINAAVAMDADGDFVITWEGVVLDSPGNEGTVTDIFARRFSPVGVVDDADVEFVQGVKALGDQFRVNTFITGAQAEPDVGMDDDGNFVIAWYNEGQHVSFFNGITAQRFNRDGDRIGSEWMVNNEDTMEHGSPYVAMSADGHFSISWVRGGSLAEIYDPDGTVLVNQFSPMPIGGRTRVISTSAMFDEWNNILYTVDSDLDVDLDGRLISDGVHVTMFQLYNRGGTFTPDNFNFGIIRPEFYANNQPLWPHDQRSSQAGLDADGDIIITYAGYGPDVAQVYNNPVPYNVGDLDLLVEGGLYPAQKGGADDEALALSRYGTDMTMDYLRGEADGVMYTRVDADPLLETHYREMDSVVNTHRDGHNEKDLIEIHGWINGGKFIMWLYRDGVPDEFGGIDQYDEIEVSVVVSDTDPPFLLPIETAEAIEQALSTATNPDHAHRTGIGWPEPTFMGPVNVRVVGAGEITARQGTYWDMGVNPANYVFEVTFLGSSHDWGFDLILADRPDANQLEINGNPGPPPVFSEYAKGCPGINQDNSAMGIEPDGDFVVAWTQFEQLTNWQTHQTDTRPLTMPPSPLAPNNVYYRRFDESTDTAGPLATDFLLPSGGRLDDGAQVSEDLQFIIVTFDEKMRTDGSENDVTDTRNWALMQDGVELLGGISEVHFGMNMAKTLGLTGIASNKWEAVVMLDANGQTAGTPALTEGTYEIVALNSLRDEVGNALGRTGFEINGQSFSREFYVSIPSGDEILVNDDTAGDQSTFPESPQTIAGDADGDHVVVWTSTGADPGVYAKLYDTVWTDTPSGRESTITAIGQIQVTDDPAAMYASVARDDDGDFVVTWSAYDAGGTSWNVWFQRYDALGRPQGDAEMANSHTEDIQRFSTVAMDNDGDFVITWQSQNQDGSGYGIFAQRYTRAGDVIDGLDEIQVIRFTGNPEGTFGLTWNGHVTGPISYSGDISDVADQIQAEFDALGIAVDVQPHGYTEVTIRFTDELSRMDQPPIMMDFVSIEGMPGADISVGTLIDGVTSEFRVNDTTSGNQQFPSIAMEAGGTFLVTWTSSGQDGDDPFETNVYAKLFEGAGIGGSYSGGGGGVGGGGGPGGPGGGGVQVYVDPGEQLFVYLLNRARNDPQAYEAERDLPISLAGVEAQPPAAVNYNLFDSSGFKSEEMAQYDYFGHQSDVTGIWPNELSRDFGYPLDPSFPDDSNQIESLAAGTFIDTAAEALELLIIDEGVVPPGHRIHLLGMDAFNADNREIGVGYAVNGASMYTNYWAIHLTRSDPADRFITGVVYSDANGNGLYDLNEGIGGVTVDAGGQVATTNSAGGYSIEVQPGDYNVTASGGSYNGVGSTMVTVNGGNVEVDFISGQDGAWVNFDYVAGGPAAPGPGGGGGTGVVTLTNEFLVNETTDYNQDFSTVAMDTDGDFVVSWTSYGQDEVGSGYGPGVDGENGVYARRYNADATPSGGEFQANTYAAENQQYSRISMDADGDFMIAWESFQDRSEGSGAGNNYGIYAQRYSANAGGPFLGPNGEIGSELAVNSTKSGDQRWPGVALNNTGDAVVVWSGNGAGDDQGIFLQRYEKPEDTAGPIVTDVHDVGSDTLDYVLENDVINAYVGRFVVTFGENLDTEYSTIGTTSVLNTNNWMLKKNGETISGGVAEVEFGLNQAFVSGLADAPSNKYEAVITFDLDPTKEGEQRLDDGEYVLTVSHYVQDLFGNYLDGNFDGYPGGVFDRTFFVVTADTEFRVNDDPDGDQYTLPDGLAEDEIPNSPQAVADDADGDYVVVWTSDGAAGHSAGVYATLYKTTWTNLEPGRDSDVAVFDEILVTPDPTATYASVAMDADGDFVVTWSAHDTSGATGWDVWYMRFDAMRRPQMADPEMVNTHTDGDQRFSTVAMDHDGDFVITWQSSGQEGSGYEVYAQRYNRAGDALGGLSGEVRVNDTTEGDQRFPTVAMDAVGDFVISWTSSGQDGDGPNENNIFAKRFVSNDTIFGTGNSPGNSSKKSDPPGPGSADLQKILTVDDPNNHIVPPGTDADGVAMVWDAFGGMGTGSLLSSGRHILTAAHVVSDWFGNALPPSMITTVFNLPDGDVTIGSSQIFVHPNYNGDIRDGYDVAIITLQQTAPTQIPRYDIYRESNELGQTFIQFGFGYSGTGDTGEDLSVPFDIRRSGQNQYEGFGTLLGYDASILVYDFDNGQAANDALGQNYGIANTGLGDAETNSGRGDSGGPCFINGLIAGITSGGADPSFFTNTDVTPGVLDSSFGEISIDARISVVSSWIDGIVGAGGAEFRVNQTVSSNQQWSSVAMDTTGYFVITWTNYGDPIDSSSNEIGPSGQQDIFARYYDNEANALTGDFQVNTYSIGTQQHSQIAMGIKGDFVITWESFDERPDPSFGMSDILNTFGIRAKGYWLDEGVVGDELAVNATTAGHQRLPGVAMDDTGDFVIVWSGNGEMPGEEDDQGIFARRFDRPTDVAGATVTDVDNVVTLDGGVIALEHVTEDIVLFTEVENFVITFGENLNFNSLENVLHSVVNPANWTLTQDGQTIPDGVASIRFGLNEAHNWNAAIPESNKYEAVLTFDLDAEEPGYQPLDSGRFVVTVGSSIWDLFDNPLDGNVNGVSGDPFAMAFNLFDAVPGDPGDDDIDSQVNTTDVGDQNDSAVARNDNGDYVVVWVDYSSMSGQADIMGQRFDFVGRKVDNEFLVNNLTTNDQIEPDVAIDNDGNFVVVWSGDGDRLGDDSGVFAQLYDADGRTVGGQFLVNQFTQDSQDAPAVTMNADGEFLVTWTSFGQDGSRDGVFARWFDPLGQPMDDEFLVNTTTIHAQRTPDVAINGSGDFVITWASDGQDANDWGVYAQRFDAASNRIGGEFRVNEYQNDEQIDPQIAMTEEGSFVITWASYLQDGSGFGVYARLYNAAGGAGNEFRVNETTVHWQQQPAVAMNSTKGFVITWTSFNQDNPQNDDLRDNGIYARMFNADGSNYLADDGSVLGEFRVNATTVGDQVEPAVSMDALGIYVVTWTGPDPFLGIDTDIYSRLLDPPIEVDTTVTYTDVHLTGTEGDDLFEFVAGPTSASWIVKINGQMQYAGDTVGILTFDGLGGADTVLITGTDADETLEMWPDHGTYGDGDYVLELSNVEVTTAVGGGGTDVAYLHDSVGNDTFTSTPIDAELTGDGFLLRAESFRYAHGFADAGGTDVAMLHDSPGDDTFTSYPAYVRMTGEGFYTKAHGFEYAKGYSTAGDDVANLYDSSGDDTYVATPEYSKLYGESFYTLALSFPYTKAYSRAGGTDTAIMTDSPGDDILVATPTYAKFYGETFYNRADGFDYVKAYGKNGGDDVASLHDSAGDDRFVAGPHYGKMYGDGFYIRADFFRYVTGYAANGGNDVADLFDSAGDDFLVVTPLYGKLYNDTFYNRAYTFETVNARATAGGYDVANLFDSAMDEYLEADDNWARLSNVDLDFSYWVADFDRVTAHSSNSGDTKHVAPTVDFLIANGMWEDE